MVEFMCHISSPLSFSPPPSQCLYICTVICLFTCEKCVPVFPHVLYALSACSQLIKTQCQLSCFLPAWLPGVCSSRQQPPLPPPLLRLARPLSSNLRSDFFFLLFHLTLHLSLSLSLSVSLNHPVTQLLLLLPLTFSSFTHSAPSSILVFMSKLKTSHCQTVTCFIRRRTFRVGKQSLPENRPSPT